MKQKLSVLILTFNEENNIKDCLESVKWADEIFIIDSFSTDRTLEISRNYTDKIVQRRWEGFAKQRIFSLEQATNEWILNLDADERISDELKLSIENVLLNNPEVDGYEIPRKNYFLGRWIRSANWYPDYQLRLFRKSKASVVDVPIHEAVTVNGILEKLRGDIIHYSYQSLEAAIQKINHYSTLAAEQRKNKKVNALDLVLHPLAAFLTDYFSRGAYKDGVHGLLVAVINMLTNLMTYSKIWEMQRVNRKT